MSSGLWRSSPSVLAWKRYSIFDLNQPVDSDVTAAKCLLKFSTEVAKVLKKDIG